ncbi:MAG: SRPBCC domain-containing protein [Chlorobi bacterium]|nr:SRPBCC domain-containing protein [Chlorobiota bacterium]MCI0716365.1 SRPBCC domain-containing protein [Chlorobiota bacterium]
MEKLNFSIKINAPRKKVWSVLFDDPTYRNWTSVFAPGSYAETDWKEGSKALFLDGKGNGMVSRIAKSNPHEYLSINHIGIIKDGIEDTQSDEVKKWAGALENYTLNENSGVTELKIDMDSDNEYKDYFSKTWPKALEKVKELSEK